MRRHTPPPPGGPRTAPEGDTQIWPRPSTSILGPPTASTLSRPGPTSLLTHTSEPTCSGSAYVSALAPYGRPRVALFGRPLTSLDTFYIGKLKGVGKVWQITACDVASSYGPAAVLPSHTAVDAARFLRDTLVPR